MISGRWCRGVRAALFAAVCVLLTATGHVLMSGAPVPWWTAAVALGATGGAAWCLAGRERGLPSVTAATVVVQAALHSLFSLAQSAAASPATGGAAAAHAAAHSGHAVTGHDRMAHGSMPGHGMGEMSSTGMLAAHLVAALLCGLWLAHGERAAFRVLRALASLLLAPLRALLRLPAPPHRPRVRSRRGPRAARTLRQLLLAHALVTRGPPPAAAVR
ncbi:hypothetical protein ABZ957_30855 [Streptomyces sp. NPDC046316]|uniref:hypothetical protein n=1 Tax=Streptomyces sp. NPDC046316 TaxID=3154494 RepID=UPI0033C091A3